MKKGILLLLLIATGSTAVQAQKLKDLLYGGKLRSDSNTVVRKTDDLSTKIDTAQKKPVATAMAPTSVDTISRVTPSADVAVAGISDSVAADTVAKTEVAAVAGAAAAPVKSNNRIWKEYTDSLANTLKAEVLPNKKIKKETYYLTVAYEINTDGQVSITNVTATPENALLQSQVKQRIEVAPPPLNPVLDSNGKPRKITRNYNFSVTKE